MHDQLELQFDDLVTVIPSPADRSVQLLPLNEYDIVILHLSAGADSMGCLFELKKQGLDFRKLEIWHQCVDGHEDTYTEFWDWPCTESYIEAVGQYFNVPVYYQWRAHGIHGELYREDRRTADVYYTEGGLTHRLPTTKGKMSTRRRFPAQSSDLSRRWCSAAAKADPARRVLANHPRMTGTRMRPVKILFVTGERRSEGGNRANYLKQELHASSSSRRIVHHWRPVIDMTKADMFELHREFKIMPHPAYYLGFGRVSCMGCIFLTKHHWRVIQHIAADRFQRFVDAEHELQHTIDVKESLLERVATGILEKVLPVNDPLLPHWIDLCMKRSFGIEDLLMTDWIMPIGARAGCQGGAS